MTSTEKIQRGIPRIQNRRASLLSSLTTLIAVTTYAVILSGRVHFVPVDKVSVSPEKSIFFPHYDCLVAETQNRNSNNQYHHHVVDVARP